MPKRHQQHPAKAITGHNKSSKTTEGTHYRSELDITKKADSQEQMQERERRSGTDSNANKPRKGSRLHNSNKEQKQPSHHEKYNDFSSDLEGNNLAGEHHGMRDPNIVDYGHTAYDIKELYQPLADLTDDEMKSLVLVAEGSRLEQGARYIDLDHLEQGEFTATANMIAEAGHHYVPKKEVDTRSGIASTRLKAPPILMSQTHKILRPVHPQKLLCVKEVVTGWSRFW